MRRQCLYPSSEYRLVVVLSAVLVLLLLSALMQIGSRGGLFRDEAWYLGKPSRKSRYRDAAFLKREDLLEQRKPTLLYDMVRMAPWFSCQLTRQEPSDPVATPWGTIYEFSAIARYIKKHKTCPVTKKPLRFKDLTRLNVTRSQRSSQEKFCPISKKRLDHLARIVYIRTSGRVYAAEAIDLLQQRNQKFGEDSEEVHIVNKGKSRGGGRTKRDAPHSINRRRQPHLYKRVAKQSAPHHHLSKDNDDDDEDEEDESINIPFIDARDDDGMGGGIGGSDEDEDEDDDEEDSDVLDDGEEMEYDPISGEPFSLDDVIVIQDPIVLAQKAKLAYDEAEEETRKGALEFPMIQTTPVVDTQPSDIRDRIAQQQEG